jgi:pimeloyl-ACP methyl ester carboxylesterase
VVLEDATLDNPDPRRNTISATAYGPSTDGASLDAGPFPLVVVLPGFSTRHGAYRHFTDHLVSHGFAVLGVTPANVGFTDTPNNPANVAEIERAIQWAFEQSLLSGKLDATRMAVAGHSQGGKLAFFTAATDDRFSVVIGWDPQNGGGAPCFVAGFTGQDCNGWPVAPSCDTDRDFQDPGMLHNLRAETLVFAARDTAVTPDQHLWAEHFYRGAPSPASLLLFPAAGHGDWGGAGATTDLTKRVQLALLLTRFMGKRGLERYLPEGEAVSEDASVMVFTK